MMVISCFNMGQMTLFLWVYLPILDKKEDQYLIQFELFLLCDSPHTCKVFSSICGEMQHNKLDECFYLVNGECGEQ